jgi:hypothetical protein
MFLELVLFWRYTISFLACFRNQIIKVASGQETPLKKVYSNNNSLLIDVDMRFLVMSLEIR